MTASPTRRTAAHLVLALSAAALFVLATPGVASAHDELVSTTPASQEHLDVAPEEVSLVFSAALLDIGATILVVDDEGNDRAIGDMRLEATTVIQPIEADLPDGHYQVRWRVVASDGHPISGTFDFAIGQPAASGTGNTGTGNGQPPEATTLPEATSSTANRDDLVVPPLVLIGIGGALAGVVVFVLIISLLPRARRGR